VQKLENITTIASSIGLDVSYPFPLERITLQTPSGTPGKADITVTSPAGSVTATKSFQFLQSENFYASPKRRCHSSDTGERSARNWHCCARTGPRRRGHHANNPRERFPNRRHSLHRRQNRQRSVQRHKHLNSGNSRANDRRSAPNHYKSRRRIRLLRRPLHRQLTSLCRGTTCCAPAYPGDYFNLDSSSRFSSPQIFLTKSSTFSSHKM
jgi:hypothetical protein